MFREMKQELQQIAMTNPALAEKIAANILSDMGIEKIAGKDDIAKGVKNVAGKAKGATKKMTQPVQSWADTATGKKVQAVKDGFDPAAAANSNPRFGFTTPAENAAAEQVLKAQHEAELAAALKQQQMASMGLSTAIPAVKAAPGKARSAVKNYADVMMGNKVDRAESFYDQALTNARMNDRGLTAPKFGFTTPADVAAAEAAWAAKSPEAAAYAAAQAQRKNYMIGTGVGAAGVAGLGAGGYALANKEANEILGVILEKVASEDPGLVNAYFTALEEDMVAEKIASALLKKK